MNNDKIKKILIYFTIACFLYFSHEILSNIFYYIIYYPLNVNYDWILAHTTQIEAYSTLCLLPIYLFIFVKVSYTKGRLIHSKIKANKVLASIILVFTINGLSKLWFDIVEAFLSNIPAITGSMESFDNAFSSMESESYIWTLIPVVIVGPIIEELLFRGLLIKTISKILPESFAVIISAILFGVWHGILVQTVYTAVMGLIIGFVYIKTRSIIYPIIIHIGNNFINGFPVSWSTPAVETFISNFSVSCIVPGLALLYFIFYKHPEEDRLPSLE